MELRLAVQKHQQNFILFKYRQIIYLAIVYISVIFHNYSLIIQIDNSTLPLNIFVEKMIL